MKNDNLINQIIYNVLDTTVGYLDRDMRNTVYVYLNNYYRKIIDSEIKQMMDCSNDSQSLVKISTVNGITFTFIEYDSDMILCTDNMNGKYFKINFKPDLSYLQIDNKYYIPTIDEFYVGFEYEVGLISEYRDELLWISLIYTERDFKSCNDIYEPSNVTSINQCILQQLKENIIRVKYLDRKDIESLGWIVNSDYNHTINAFIDWYRLSYDLVTHKLKIWRHGGNNEVFKLTIKNISELKRLIKQLGIEWKQMTE